MTSAQYGLPLKRILAERNISISTLAQRLDLPSRNTIHRIMAGSSKYESVEKLHRRICENQARLHFSEEELQLLQEALEHCRYGGYRRARRKAVMDLILRPVHPVSAAPCVCCISTEPVWCGKTIQAVIEHLTEYADVEILLLNAAYPQLLDAVEWLVARTGSSNTQCRVRHVLSSTDDAFTELQQFMQLQSLLAGPCYGCYRVQNEDGNGMNSTDQRMIICKRSHAGRYTVDIVSFLSDRAFTYCTDLPDDNGRLVQYYAAYGQMLVAQCACLNPQMDSAGAVANMLAMNAEFAQYEQCWSQILVKPDLCISQIPTEYMMRLVRDSGYLGLSPDAPEILEFARVHQARYANFVSGTHGYVFIFTESGLRRFMQTGRLSDHVEALPAFTMEERRNIVEGVIRVAEKNRGVLLHMFRDDTVYTGMTANLFDEKIMYVFNTGQMDYGNPTLTAIRDYECIKQMRSEIHDLLTQGCLYNVGETMQQVQRLLDHDEAMVGV